MLYAPHGNCHFSDSNSRSTTLYTPNNQTLTDFFFEKDVELSVKLDSLSPSTNYCCVVVASNSHGSTMSEVVSFETEAECKEHTKTACFNNATPVDKLSLDKVFDDFDTMDDW